MLIQKRFLLHLCCLSLVFLSFPLSAEPVSAEPVTTTPADNPIPHRQTWFKECEDRVASAQGKPVDIMFIGDSITQNFQEEPREKWKLVGAPVWKNHYAGRNALNFGVSSDGTQHILWRMDHMNIKNFSPKVIVLLAGVNNMQSTPEEIAAGTKAVIQKCRTMYPGAKIILMAILPNRRNPAKTAAANLITKTFADNQTIYSLDLTPMMPLENGNFKGVGIDHLHLTEEGYEIWASNLDPLLNQLLKQ